MSLLLALAERLLNAFAAAVPAADPSSAGAVERLVTDYAAARSDILQHALDQAIAFCAQGAAEVDSLGPPLPFLLLMFKGTQKLGNPNISVRYKICAFRAAWQPSRRFCALLEVRISCGESCSACLHA